MTFDGITYLGAPFDDPELLDELPRELATVLRQTNGLVATNGAFHLRGAVVGPTWHSLRAVWHGPHRFSDGYRTIRESDIPFAEDGLGDQYFLRDGSSSASTLRCL